MRSITGTYKVLLPVLLAAQFMVSCAVQRGEFAFRKNLEDSYHKPVSRPEFSTTDKVKWAYVLSKVKKERALGVVVLKKELVWVEINARMETLTPRNRVIYGEINDYEAGDYRIIITEKNKKLDEIEFIIYQDKDDLTYR